MIIQLTKSLGGGYMLSSQLLSVYLFLISLTVSAIAFLVARYFRGSLKARASVIDEHLKRLSDQTSEPVDNLLLGDATKKSVGKVFDDSDTIANYINAKLAERHPNGTITKEPAQSDPVVIQLFVIKQEVNLEKRDAEAERTSLRIAKFGIIVSLASLVIAALQLFVALLR